MGWLSFGFLATWYAAFAALYIRNFGTGENALLLAVGHFVCLPVLLLGACGAVAEGMPALTAAVDAAVDTGRGSRRGAFLAGAVGALGSMVVVALLAGVVNALGEFGWIPLVTTVLAPPAGLFAGARWVEWSASHAEPAAPDQSFRAGSPP